MWDALGGYLRGAAGILSEARPRLRESNAYWVTVGGLHTQLKNYAVASDAYWTDTGTPELYLRATAASTFMPIMQYHSEFNHHRLPLRDRTPWHVATMTGDERVVPVNEFVVVTRYGRPA